ncbi:hypothetical protein PSYJA_41192, partial [Pseudomonas syringae pv. japonica str. M301072]
MLPPQADAMPDQRAAFMPMDDPPHDRQAQPMPARGSGWV